MSVHEIDHGVRDAGEDVPLRDVESFTLRDAPAPAPDPPRRRSPMGWIAALAAVVVAAAVLGYLSLNRRGAERVATAPTAVTPTPATPVPTDPSARRRLGGDAPAVDLPPLDQSDATVAALVRSLSTHPTVTAWLATNGLVRTFVMVVANIARGRAPRAQLQALHPLEPFRVLGRQDVLTVDPRGYRRYDAVATAVATLDPAGTAGLYAALRPRLDDAYRELGNADVQFDDVLEQAIVLLLRTPVPDQAPRLIRAPKGIGYRYADPRLEALTPAQKQLLRLGPDNVRRVQSSLRAIALALGIPATRVGSP